MAEKPELIKITIMKEEEIDRVEQRGGGYLVTTSRTGVDQYGKMWHSIHTKIVFDEQNENELKNPLV